MLRREDVVRRMLALRTEEVVVTTQGTVVPWGIISKHPRDFASHDSAMGHTADFALGLALARPDLRVWVFNGDGSLLMSLGTLVTIAAAAPPNLVHFVFDNGVYEVTGNQPVPGGGSLDYAGMARAAGTRCVFAFDDPADLAEALPEALRAEGPVFIALRVALEEQSAQSRRPDHPVPSLRMTLAEEAHRLRGELGGVRS
ncbi:MAG: thiamine pyrophosphate-binding protein [Armatimonadetes bacterium]|nr:thiamine pyrophosphate-binding protein [Armatimonadota bacterium]